MVVVGAHTPCLGRAVYICWSLRHRPSHRRAAGCLAPESSWVPRRLPKPTRHPISFFFPLPYTQGLLYGNRFFFLRRTHEYCSIVIVFFSFAVYTNTARSVPFFFHDPAAHLKSSPSDDESESETFVFRRFRGLVHDKSIFSLALHSPKGVCVPHLMTPQWRRTRRRRRRRRR